ncbi:MAG: TlpA family protein disulfide reductase [Microthrixaceae bacterium]
MAVAVDESPDDVRPFVDGITFPVLVDREHTLAERYAISNVPTVVLIDRGRIAKPNWVAFGTDTFAEFTGVASGPQLDAVRHWARTGEVDVEVDDAAEVVGDLSEDELTARLHFRIAAHLRRTGDEDGAARNFAEAVRLAPHDWTVRRAAMPLQGVSPFGEAFLEMAAEWEAAGRPYHGLAAEQRVTPED